MTIRRATGAVCAVLLLAVSVAVAEAALLVLILVLSSVLSVQLDLERSAQLVLGPWLQYPPGPTMTVHEAGIVASSLFAVMCGAVAAVLRYRRWRPA
jgi:hypothetical protein